MSCMDKKRNNSMSTIDDMEHEYHHLEQELENKRDMLEIALKKEFEQLTIQIDDLINKKQIVKDKMNVYNIDSKQNKQNNRTFKIFPSRRCLSGIEKVKTIDEPFNEIEISVDIGEKNGIGEFVGIQIDQDRIIFHPGWTQPKGAFRIDGPNHTENQDMGFLPTLGQLYNFNIIIDKSMNMSIKIKDTNSSKFYMHELVNNKVNTNFDISLITGSRNGCIGLFNNLSIKID